jgi:ABC-2 type transport system permease protein
MIVLIKRLLRGIRNDKRLLGLVFVAPLLIMTLINLFLNSSARTPIVAIDTSHPLLARLATALDETSVTVAEYDAATAAGALAGKTIDATVTLDDGGLTLTLLEPNAAIAAGVSRALQDAQVTLTGAAAAEANLVFLYGDPAANLFDAYGYIFLAYISFFFVFLLAGIAFIRERSQGTLERFILSPIKRSVIIAGYTIAYGILATIQSVIVVLFAVYVLGLNLGDNVLSAILIMGMMSLAAVSIGLLVSVLAGNEFQMVQMIPVVVIPQALFIGLIPLDSIPFGLGNLAYVMPLYYAANALKKVTVYNESLSAVAPELAILLGLTLVLGLINTRVLRQFRKI